MTIRTALFAPAAMLVAATLALLGPAPATLAGPEPSIVPSRWQLDFRPGDLRLAIIEVEISRTGPDGRVYTQLEPRAYLFMTYQVVNNTGEDRLFAPSFELATEEGTIRRSGRNVPVEVVDALLRKLENPFLEDEISVIRTLGQGPENARDGLVVWAADGLKADEITVFARGFSGETKRYTRPDTGEEVTLHKEMMLRHDTPGDLATYLRRPLPRAESRWILR